MDIRTRVVKLLAVAGIMAAMAPRFVCAADAPAAKPEPVLIFHVDFNDRVDAVVSAGNGKAVAAGTLVYEQSPDGKGLVLGKDVSLSYAPKGNFNLQKGRLAIRFKPSWRGDDPNNRFLLRLNLTAGLIYFAKLNDGRILMNMFDKNDKQHYPQISINKMEAGGWHDVTVTWDIAKGVMTMKCDNETADFKGDPWQMGAMGDTDYHRLMIPADAGVVIDDLKIWNE
jgi:hypothetical protein